MHEAYLRLNTGEAARFESREHFLGVAARAMRRVLVDHARRKRSAKRGGGGERLHLDAIVSALEHEEAARVLGVSEKTVRRSWEAARLWLRKELEAGSFMSKHHQHAQSPVAASDGRLRRPPASRA